MECFVIIGLFAAAIGFPVVLGWLGIRYRFAQLLLFLSTPVLSGLGAVKLCEATAMQTEADQRVNYPLETGSTGWHSIVIVPLQGKHMLGLGASVVRRGGGSVVTCQMLKDMNWRCSDLRDADWFDEDWTRGGDGTPLFETRHQQLDQAIVVEYEVKQRSIESLKSLEISVRPNACALKDLNVGILVTRWEGILFFIPAGIGVIVQVILLLRKAGQLNATAQCGT
jgi:hypothetical protein